MTLEWSVTRQEGHRNPSGRQRLRPAAGRRSPGPVRPVRPGHDVAGVLRQQPAPDPTEREAINAHVLALIDAAALLGVPTVGTFVGRDPTKSVAENLREAEQVFKPLVDHAGEREKKIIIENCVMEGWHPGGYPGNLAYSPELWEWMFAQGLYLNYDPSHLVWMGIDPVAALRPYVDAR